MIHLKSLLFESIDLLNNLTKPTSFKVSKLKKDGYQEITSKLGSIEPKTADIDDSSTIVILPENIITYPATLDSISGGDLPKQLIRFVNVNSVKSYIILVKSMYQGNVETGETDFRFVLGISKKETVDTNVTNITNKLQNLYDKGIHRESDGSFSVYAFTKFEKFRQINIDTLIKRNLMTRLSQFKDFSDEIAKLNSMNWNDIVKLITSFQYWYIVDGDNGKKIESAETMDPGLLYTGIAYASFKFPASLESSLDTIKPADMTFTDIVSADDFNDDNAPIYPGFEWFYDVGYDKTYEYKRDANANFYTRKHGETKEYNLTASLKRKKNPKLKSQLDSLEAAWNEQFNPDGTKKAAAPKK